MTDANLLMAAAMMIAGAFVAWRLLPRAVRGATAAAATPTAPAAAPVLQA